MTKTTRENLYGVWHVKTEGDCEGRTTKDLGTHTGFLDEIAFKLAEQAYYALEFSEVDTFVLNAKLPVSEKVTVRLNADSMTWDLNSIQRAEHFREMLRGRDLTVSESLSYGCVELHSGASAEARAAAKRQVIINRALNKLTPEEIEALGV